MAGDIEFKSFPTGDPLAYTQVIGKPHETVDPTTGQPVGIVEALVAVTGVVDEVGDVFVPGSFRRTIGEIKAKGVSAHDWKVPVSKALKAEEWMPGDPRLPKVLPNGKPWPSEAGAVYVKALHNLKTEPGRTAYANAEFYGPEQNYSVGYKVTPGGAVKKGGIRYIRDHDWYEWSDVLHGANRLAHLLSVKADLTGELERSGFKPSAFEDLPEVEEPRTDGMVALVPSPSDAARLAVDGADPADELHMTLFYLGDDVTSWPEGSGQRLVDLLTAGATGLRPIDGTAFAHATFNPDGGEHDPCAVYVIGDVGEAENIRTWLGSVLRDGADYVTPPEQRTPWIPHVTAGYGLPVDQLGYTGPVRFDRLRLALGGQVTDVPLGSRLGLLDDEYKMLLEETETKEAADRAALEVKDIHSGSVGTTTGPASMRPEGKTTRCKFCSKTATTRLSRDGRVLPVPVCADHRHGEGKSAVPVNEGGDLLVAQLLAAGFRPRVEIKVMSPDPRAAKLREYWAHGPGRRKWKPGIPGDFKRLRRHLAKFITNPKVLNGLTANIHKLATGEWPGKRAHGGKSMPMPENLEPSSPIEGDDEPMDERLIEGVDEFTEPFGEEDTAGYDFDEDSIFFEDADTDTEVDELGPDSESEAVTSGDDADELDTPADIEADTGAVDDLAEEDEPEATDEELALQEQRLAVQEGKAAVLDLADLAALQEVKLVPVGAVDELTLNLERLALAEDTLVDRDEVDEDTWAEVVARDRAYRLDGGAELVVDPLAEQGQNSRSDDGIPVPAATEEVPLLDQV